MVLRRYYDGPGVSRMHYDWLRMPPGDPGLHSLSGPTDRPPEADWEADKIVCEQHGASTVLLRGDYG